MPERYQDGRSSAPQSDQTRAVVSAVGVDCQRLDVALLERYFDEYVATGFLPPPGRAGWSAGDQGWGAAASHDDPAFFEPMLRQRLADDSVRVTRVTLHAQGSEHSVIGELSSWRHHGRTGLFHYRLTLVQQDVERTLDVVTKVEPVDREMIIVSSACMVKKQPVVQA